MLVFVNISAYRDEQEHSESLGTTSENIFTQTVCVTYRVLTITCVPSATVQHFPRSLKYSTQYTTIYINPTKCNSVQYLFLLITAGTFYMFQAILAPIIKRTINCRRSYWCLSWVGMVSELSYDIVWWSSDLGHLYGTYTIPTNDNHQWLRLQFMVLLMMGTKKCSKHVEYTCSC